MSNRATEHRRLGGPAALIAVLAATAGVFVVVEGAASMALAINDIVGSWRLPPASRQHAQFDRRLGWVNRPNLRIDDMYGPGRFLETNDRGFRHRIPVSTAQPEGTRRVICSGDSFTLGYGVSNDSTWCALLGSERIETVNMGQSGYGIGQAFMWYIRDGIELEHDVHIMAFIHDDFRRMGLEEFMGMGKPRLALRGGRLVEENVPVPRRGRLRASLIQNGALFGEFRSVRLLQRLIGRVAGPAGGEADVTGGHSAEREAVAVAATIFDSLGAVNASKGSRLVLLFLPARWDYRFKIADSVRADIAAYARSRPAVEFIDLVGELRELPPHQAASLFYPEGHANDPHMTEAGNAWVADRVRTRLFGEEPPGVGSHGKRASPHRRGVS